MLSQEDFLSLFKNSKKQSLNEFLKTYKVKTSIETYKLNKYIEKKEIDVKEIEKLKEIIDNKDDYLIRFYNTSLRLPDNLRITEEPMKNKKYNNNLIIKYKNVIRNMHFYDILRDTKSGFNIKTYLEALFDLFNNKIIDYKILCPSALFYIKRNGFGGVMSSFFFRASILNPYLIYSLNKTLLKGTRVFTPTLGWSSYLYGLFESGLVKEYVGTDVLKNVCEKTKMFAKNYPNITTKIYNKPSENLLNSKLFSQKYEKHFDLVFFSPPYFKLELYEGNNQSTSNYKNYDEWLEKYWRKTVECCYYVLENNGKMCYILSGYGSDNTHTYDLVNDMNKITKEYFKFHSVQPMYNKDVHVTKHKVSNEKIILFEKKI
jgi:hypothetical protein